MEPVKRVFEVINPFSTGPDDAKVNYEVGAVVEFVDNEEFAAKIADGSLVEVPVVSKDDLSDEDKASLAAAEEAAVADAAKKQADEEAAIKAAEEKAAADAAAAAAGPVLTYAGKTVIRDTTRVVEGREYHHITLATGESLDITDEEHAAMIEAAK